MRNLIDFRHIKEIVKQVYQNLQKKYIENPEFINPFNIYLNLNDFSVNFKYEPSKYELTKLPEVFLNLKQNDNNLKISFMIGVLWFGLYLKDPWGYFNNLVPYIEFNPIKEYKNNKKLFKICYLENDHMIEELKENLQLIRLLTRKNPKARINMEKIIDIIENTNKRKEDKKMERVNILHLSDIHFGIEPTEDGLINSEKVAERKLLLGKLINELRDIKLEWKPSIIVISGDVGWSGKNEDYKVAKDWIEKLMLCLKISPEHLIICPGNHDLNRDEAKFTVRANNNEEADKYLSSENIDEFKKYFHMYEKFSKDIGILPYKIGSKEGYLSGVATIDEIRFIVLNSAWFSRDNNDKGKLWIGLPQLKVLESNEQIEDNDDYINIAVLHHPNEWLAEGELHSWGQRRCTYEYLAKMSHLILSGHVHAYPKKSDVIVGASHLILGGSTYSGDNYSNNCSIIRINKEKMTMERTLLEFKPNEGEWHVNYGYENEHLKKKNK